MVQEQAEAAKQAALEDAEKAKEAAAVPKTTPAPKPAYTAPTALVYLSVSGNSYDPGQCTWGAKNLIPSIPNTLGNANQWLYNAMALGYKAYSSPIVGSVAWYKYGNHVAVVVGVNGSQVEIKEMNGPNGPFVYDLRWDASSNWDYIVF